jgi:hypothetical protein
MQPSVIRLFSYFRDPGASILSGPEYALPKSQNTYITLTLQKPKRRLLLELFSLRP